MKSTLRDDNWEVDFPTLEAARWNTPSTSTTTSDFCSSSRTPYSEPTWGDPFPSIDWNRSDEEPGMREFLRTQKRMEEKVAYVEYHQVPCFILPEDKDVVPFLRPGALVADSKREYRTNHVGPEVTFHSNRFAGNSSASRARFEKIPRETIRERIENLPRQQKRHVREYYLMNKREIRVATSPAACRKLEQKPQEPIFHWAARIESGSTATDPLRSVSVTFPDNNYEIEARETREKLSRMEFRRPLHLTSLNCPFVIELEDGERPNINFSWENSRCAIFDELKWEIHNYKDFLNGVKEIKILPVAVRNHPAVSGMKDVFLSNQAVLIRFSSSDFRADAQKKLMRSWVIPDHFVNPQYDNSDPVETYAAEFIYTVKPKNGRGYVLMKNAHEVGFAAKVLQGNGFGILRDYCETLGGRKITFQFMPSVIDTTDQLVWLLEKIFEANNLDFVRAEMYFHRPQDMVKSSLDSRQRVAKRLILTANDEKIWRGPPVARDDYENIHRIAEDESLHPWTMGPQMNYDNPPGESRIRVDFHDRVFGQAMVKKLTKEMPSTQFFSLIRKDRRGVRLIPSVRRYLNISKRIRYTLGQIEHHKKGFRGETQIREDCEFTYVRLIDDFCVNNDFGSIIVEGYPHEYVVHVYNNLINAVAPIFIDCSGESACLLYGPGLKLAETLVQWQQGKIVMDIDLYNERIALFGRDEVVGLVKGELEKFHKSKHLTDMDAQILIDEPRFSPNMMNLLYLMYDNDDVFNQHVGEDGCIKVQGNMIDFRGKVAAFERLNELLETISEELRLMLGGPNSVPYRPDCAVCLCPVPDDYFRLSCAHIYCRTCFVGQVKHDLLNRVWPLKCAQEGCNLCVSPDDLKYLILGPSNRVRSLDDQKIVPLTRAAITVALRSGAGILACPTVDCQGIYEAVPKDLPAKIITCYECRQDTCTKCRLPRHGAVSCLTNSLLHHNADMSLLIYTRNLKEGKLRNCPNTACGAIIEKERGCNHMTCSACKTEFCWLCDCFTGRVQDIYKHLHEFHKGVGGDWDPFVDDEENFGLEEMRELLMGQVLPLP
ncbi:unnamed protein product [Caenorhabditis auriculariae]|uniref:RBR-type E3 ubiquitin transferase n=1 Tax=Caenorhabditis auriculariae TaxID=2777116 RepID=A0A8S1HR41_9PELO|nr:unnamed protein product [Caenorhabditis auriculariae]